MKKTPEMSATPATTVLILIVGALLAMLILRSRDDDDGNCDAPISTAAGQVTLTGGSSEALPIDAPPPVEQTTPDANTIHENVKNIQVNFLAGSKSEREQKLKSVFGNRIQQELDLPPPRNANFPRSQDPILEKALGRGEYAKGCRRVTMTSMPQPQSDSYTLQDHEAFHSDEGYCG